MRNIFLAYSWDFPEYMRLAEPPRGTYRGKMTYLSLSLVGDTGLDLGRVSFGPGGKHPTLQFYCSSSNVIPCRRCTAMDDPEDGTPTGPAQHQTGAMPLAEGVARREGQQHSRPDSQQASGIPRR